MILYNLCRIRLARQLLKTIDATAVSTGVQLIVQLRSVNQGATETEEPPLPRIVTRCRAIDERMNEWNITGNISQQRENAYKYSCNWINYYFWHHISHPTNRQILSVGRVPPVEKHCNVPRALGMRTYFPGCKRKVCGMRFEACHNPQAYALYLWMCHGA